MMASTTTSWHNAKDEVSSWIENEQACVTAQRIAQTLGLSRKEASLLLQEILQEKDKKYQITTCRRVQKEGVTGKSYTHNSIRTPR
jgi:hypothetical protein